MAADENLKIKVDVKSKEAEKRLKALEKEAAAFKAGLLGVAAAAAAMGSAVVAAGAAAVDAYREQDAAAGRLNRSLAKVGTTTKDTLRIQALLAASSRATGESIIEETEAFRRLVDVNETVQQASEDLALANDIATASGKDLSDITQRLTDVRKGDFGSIKELDGITVEFIATLNEQENAYDAQVMAMERLRSAYGDGAKSTKGLDTDIKNLTTSFENLKGSVGKAIARGSEGGLSDMSILMDAIARKTGEADQEMVTFTGTIKGMADVAAVASLGMGPLALFGATYFAGKEVLANEIEKEREKQKTELKELQDDVLSGGESKFLKQGPAFTPEVDARIKKAAADKKKAAADAKRRREQDRADANAAAQAAFEADMAEALAMDEVIRTTDELVESNRVALEQAAMKEDLSTRLLELELNGNDALAEEVRIVNENITAREKELKLAILKKKVDGEGKKSAKKKADEEKKAAAARVAAGVAIADGAIGVAEQVGASEAAIASMKGGMELAHAAASFAEGIGGNPAGYAAGIAHTSAAAQYFAQAGTSGGGGGGGGGGADGGKKGSGGSPSVNPRDAARESAKILVEEMNRTDGGATGTTINIDFGRAIHRIDDETGREIADAVMRETERRV